ncbi:MAG: hypothetical protein COC01_06260 [Bacteroidetes bacterium]|nr:MAG: hypothetical protein COC01_06260 [Bacteroidota bacterium]
MEIEKTKTSNAELWIEDGIYILIHKADKTTSLETVQDHLRLHIELSGGKKMPLFIDMTGQIGASPEAREFGNSDEIKQTYSAIGLLVGSVFNRVLGSLFMTINKPPYPVKMFATKEEAMEWLQQFK